MKEMTEILNQNDLVRTLCREEIVHASNLQPPTSLLEEEIKTAVIGNFDQTNIEPTFKTFIAKGGTHKIVIDNTHMKYAIAEE